MEIGFLLAQDLGILPALRDSKLMETGIVLIRFEPAVVS